MAKTTSLDQTFERIAVLEYFVTLLMSEQAKTVARTSTVAPDDWLNMRLQGALAVQPTVDGVPAPNEATEAMKEIVTRIINGARLFLDHQPDPPTGLGQQGGNVIPLRTPGGQGEK